MAHLDHGVRGEAARADAAFVAELAASLGLPCDLGQWQPVRAAHFESDARRARYAWLLESRPVARAAVVAVAHTRDDQAETILHRIVRGTGLRGLPACPGRSSLSTPVTLVAPCCSTSPRSELRDYLAAPGAAVPRGSEQRRLARTRARIRHDLLPRLVAEYNPRVAEALVRLGALAEALQRSLDSDFDELERAAVITSAPDCVVLKRGYLGSAAAFLRTEVLRRVWRRAGWPEQGMSATLVADGGPRPEQIELQSHDRRRRHRIDRERFFGSASQPEPRLTHRPDRVAANKARMGWHHP